MKKWSLGKHELIDLLIHIKDCPLDTVDAQAKTMLKVSKCAGKAYQKKLVETIKKDTENNLFAISDGFWQELCKGLK